MYLSVLDICLSNVTIKSIAIFIGYDNEDSITLYCNIYSVNNVRLMTFVKYNGRIIITDPLICQRKKETRDT